MLTSQALVAIGGKASRIRRSHIDVNVSKSFIRVLGRPLLYWNLLSLHAGGIRDLVLCGDEPLQLSLAAQVIEELDVRFRRVTLFCDPGLGVHGLPYQARRYLDEIFFFECGHSIMEPLHYLQLNKEMANEHCHVTFSAFPSRASNPRQPVYLSGSNVYVLERYRTGSHALAHPMMIDQEYVHNLPRLEFGIEKIIRYYAERSEIRYAWSEMPPEFDFPDELQQALAVYEKYLTAPATASASPQNNLVEENLPSITLLSRFANRVASWLPNQLLARMTAAADH